MQKSIAVIDLNAIYNNALKIKKMLGNRRFYAVVKADAYGHGSIPVARKIQHLVYGFCVAIIEEGIALRVAGVSAPILVFTPPQNRYDCDRAAAYNLTLTVNSLYAAKLAKGLSCEIKLNTGMNRLGCDISELDKIIQTVNKDSVVGIYSHMYAPQNDKICAEQLEIFKRVKGYGIPLHISASGGLLKGGEYLFDGARCGILLYGYPPEGFKAQGFKPALKVYAKKLQTTKCVGGGAGYAPAPKNYQTLSTYRLGYAEGFSRTHPLGINKLCMDTFISESSEEWLCVMDDAQEYAKRLGTISYEVLVNCTHRAERIYEG